MHKSMLVLLLYLNVHYLSNIWNHAFPSYQKQPLNNTPATSTSSNSQQIQSSIKRTAPVELWDDIKYPNYNDDPYEFEAINRISNYTYEEPKQYTYWHYRNIVEWWEDIDPTTLRRSGSIIFVVTIVILGATLIGLAIPSDDIAILDAHSNSTALPTPKYTPIQADQHGSVDKYSPQQLLELAEQITTSCDVNTITQEESRKMCQLLCKDQMCCFEDDKYGCKGEEMCVVYAGCEALFGSEDSISKEADNSATNLLQAADEIIAYCDEYMIDPQSADGKECVARCREHMCCFEHDEESSNCKNDKVSCEVYEGCEVLVDAKESEDTSLRR